MSDAYDYKPCSRCRRNLLLCNFGTEHRNIDGRRSECRDCQREYDHKRKLRVRKMQARCRRPCETGG